MSCHSPGLGSLLVNAALESICGIKVVMTSPQQTGKCIHVSYHGYYVTPMSASAYATPNNERLMWKTEGEGDITQFSSESAQVALKAIIHPTK